MTFFKYYTSVNLRKTPPNIHDFMLEIVKTSQISKKSENLNLEYTKE